MSWRSSRPDVSIAVYGIRPRPLDLYITLKEPSWPIALWGANARRSGVRPCHQPTLLTPTVRLRGRRIRVGLVAGTEDSTPLQFAVALDEDSYLQLDDVVVTLRQVPGVGPVLTSGIVTQVRRRGRDVSARMSSSSPTGCCPRGAGDRRGDHDPRRAGVLRAAAPRGGRAPRHRRGAGAGAVLRQDGPQGADREGPRRRPDLPQPRVPRRHARRPRVDQRDLRCRHEDELRALPAVLDLPVGGARQAVGEREGARVQRQGRGPAVPRPPQPASGRALSSPTTPSWGCPPGPFASAGFYAPPTPGRPERAPVRRGPDHGRHRVLVDARGVLRGRAAALRLRRRRGRAQPVHDGDPHRGGAAAAGGDAGRRRRDRGRGADPAHLRRARRVRVRAPCRRGRPAGLGRAGHRHRARSTRSCGACVRRSSRCGAFVRARPAGHARPPGVAPRSRQVTVVDLHNLHDRAKRFVVGVTLAAETFDDKEAAGAGGRCCSSCSTS